MSAASAISIAAYSGSALIANAAAVASDNAHEAISFLKRPNFTVNCWLSMITVTLILPVKEQSAQSPKRVTRQLPLVSHETITYSTNNSNFFFFFFFLIKIIMCSFRAYIKILLLFSGRSLWFETGP